MSEDERAVPIQYVMATTNLRMQFVMKWFEELMIKHVQAKRYS